MADVDYQLRISPAGIQRCNSPASCHCVRAATKKLIFVGDSTNRGLMDTVVQQLNGAVLSSEKLHGFHRQVANGNLTAVTFEYYPKFWLQHRTSFTQTLIETLRRSNASGADSTLIVGGLDWLSIQHLHTIRAVIQSEKLEGMAVVMKTAGAGFHAPVTGVHRTSVAGVAAATRRLRLLTQAAHRRFHFGVVDTWNMTLARYADFFAGQCQCHFHQIVEEEKEEEKEEEEEEEMDASSSAGLRFRVTGAIHQAYSQILMDQLCRHPSTS